jgi:hypothetical protein
MQRPETRTPLDQQGETVMADQNRRAERLMHPANGRLVYVPPYRPALHPMARLWLDLKDDVAGQQVMRVEAQ